CGVFSDTWPFCSMFFTAESVASTPIHLIYEDDFDGWLASQNEITRNWANANAFKGERHKLLLIPASDGKAQAVLVGLGRRGRDELTCWTTAGLPDRLPDGRYHIATALPASAAAQAAFGWAYGQYR